MSKEFRMKLEKVFDALGEIIAVIALLLFVFDKLNANFGWLQDATALSVITICNAWAGLLLIAVTGLEAMIKRNFLFRIIFYILLAIAIIFMFFPGTYDALINQANALINK